MRAPPVVADRSKAGHSFHLPFFSFLFLFFFLFCLLLRLLLFTHFGETPVACFPQYFGITRRNILSNPSRSQRQNLGLTLFSFVLTTMTMTMTRTLTKILALPGYVRGLFSMLCGGAGVDFISVIYTFVWSELLPRGAVSKQTAICYVTMHTRSLQAIAMHVTTENN